MERMECGVQALRPRLGGTANRALALCLLVTGCRGVIDAEVTYRDCPEEDADVFPEDATLERLEERCWRVANAENDPSDVFVFDGDLIIRVNEPRAGIHEQWSGDDEAPMVFQAVDDDFLLVTRVEAVHKITGDHCLAEGNMAGLVARRGPGSWTTFLLGPFDLEEFDCADESEAPPPTMAAIRSAGDGWGPDSVARGPEDLGIGEDGEADLAICRVDDVLTYFYRDPVADPPAWISVADHRAGDDPLDIGMTAAGADPNYGVEGHFDWVVFRRHILGDGCAGALAGLTLPE
jgi:hypothetical protein